MKLPTILPVFLILLIGCNEVVEPDPIPQFEISKGKDDLYAGGGFIVVDQSQNASNIKWDFGDGTFAQDTIVQHTYPEKGEYTLSLTACNSSGCKEESMQLVVKDSMINLLAGRESKTWYLTSWIDRNGNSVDFDSCTCIYYQTFYTTYSGSLDLDGDHKWTNSGLQVCGGNPVRCGWPEDGYFELRLDPWHNFNSVMIGARQRLGYQIIVDEQLLSLRNNSTMDWLYYKEKK